jgi:8-amino-7-oxononanoate synthase
MSLSLEQTLQQRLAERRALSRYRVRPVVQSPQTPEIQVDGRRLTAFCSNDYLGLATHPKVIEAFHLAVDRYGVGSGASHLVCGHSQEHHKLEEELAEFTGRARALLFSTGYMANLGAVNALIGRGDAVFEDRLNHASLLDAGLLSGARFQRFRHNDTNHLRKQLQASDARHKMIVVDGVFSMDGDLAPLPELAQVAQEFDAWLMVDDAHGLGCLGAKGGGCLDHFGLTQEDVPILMGTLGKAFGTFGAFVAGSEALIESLIQFARPYIYTTALPPAVAAATRAALRLVREEGDRRVHLQNLVQRFRSGAQAIGLELWPSPSAIQPIIVGDDARALRLTDALRERGFWVSTIRPPTVPEGTARLRVTLSAAHTVAQVDGLLNALAESWREVGAPGVGVGRD